MSPLYVVFYALIFVDLISAQKRSYRRFKCVADIPDPELSSQPNSFVQFIKLNVDTTLEVQIFNADQLESTEYPPLLFIHDNVGSRWSWLSTIQCMDFFKSHAFIVPSLKGSGDSQIYDRQNVQFSIERFAEELIQLLDILGVDEAIWIGVSQGGFITYYSAAIYPKRVKSMVLIGTGTRIPESVCDEFLNLIGDETCNDRDVVDSIFPKSFLAEEISPDYADQVVREAYKPEANTYQSGLVNWCEFDGSLLLGDLTLKTTLIWGDLDEIVPFEQEFVDSFKRTKPNVFIIENAGHQAHWFDPRQVSQIIIDHIVF